MIGCSTRHSVGHWGYCLARFPVPGGYNERLLGRLAPIACVAQSPNERLESVVHLKFISDRPQKGAYYHISSL